ncbi:MAG: acyl-CoA dehydrogenase family protein [candidate division WOR-3 bacterium]
MDFTFTEEQQLIQQIARNFARNEVQPKIRDNDRAGTFDPKILKQMAQLGLLGLTIPAAFGGSGGDYIALGLACEELEYVDTSLRVILSVHIGLVNITINAWGNEQQKQRYLVPQAKGEKIAAFGLTEPGAGSDVVGISARAQRRNGKYIITGEKTWISLADVADHFLIFAWTDPDKKARRDHTGISCFIVERGMPGLDTTTIHGKLGVRAGNTGSIILNEVPVPEENRLGAEGDGFRIAMFAIDQGRYTVAAGAAGLIRACLDAAVDYARTRHTFGRPIAEHQLVKEMIGEMAVNYQAARLLYLNAGWQKNQGKTATRATSAAKLFACEAAERAASNAVQIFGAYGFSDEYPVERFFRNAKGAQIYEGTREIHKLLQADFALGLRQEKTGGVSLPRPE